MRKPKVLVVEDETYGKEIAASLKHDFGFSVCFPKDPDALAECLSTETFDGAMIDLQLKEGPWKTVWQGKRFSGEFVKDGNGVKRVALKLNDQLLAYTYTTADTGKAPKGVLLIRKPIDPHSGALKKALQSFGDATREHVRAVGPLEINYQRYNRLTFNERIQAYKKALSLNANRFKQVFVDLGNVTWLLLAGKKIRFCGESLVPDRQGPGPFRSVHRARFLKQNIITKAAKASHVFPFPFWNTSNLSYHDKQFELAGPGLSNLPATVQELFSICIAYTCGEAYVEEPDSKVLEWCKQITPEGKIHVSKLVFKRFSGDGHRGLSRFIRNTERLTLPRIVEIYDATVDKIDKAKSAAWVELRKHGEDRISMVEPFNLKLLREHGVRYENQTFEYAVYRWPTGGLGMNIELSQDHDRPMFSFLD